MELIVALGNVLWMTESSHSSIMPPRALCQRPSWDFTVCGVFNRTSL
jgi:hypothetical protein